MSAYLTGTDLLSRPVASRTLIEGIPSVCGVVMGGPQPERGLVAGAIEVVASMFFPTPLRVVVGSIGLMRIGYGLNKMTKGSP